VSVTRVGTPLRTLISAGLVLSAWSGNAGAQEAPSEDASAELPAETDEGSRGEDVADASDTKGEASAEVGASLDGSTAGTGLPKVNDEAGRPSPLDVTLGIKLASRDFRYTNTLHELYPDGGYEPLNEHHLGGSPMPTGRIHWYPGAHFMGGPLAHIGITGLYELGLASKLDTDLCMAGQPQDAEGNCSVPLPQQVKQMHQLWYGGLRGRIPVDKVTFGVEAGYGNHSFALESVETGETTGVIPDVSYTFIEFGGDAEVKWGEFYLGAQGAFSLVLDTGDLGSDAWFPSTDGYGIRFGGHTGWEAHPMLDLIAGIEMRAYGFNFNPVSLDVPDSRVAGGATDRYMSAYFALRFKLPEVAPVSAGSTPAPSKGGEDSFDDFDDF
jgi:hypothetical protein